MNKQRLYEHGKCIYNEEFTWQEKIDALQDYVLKKFAGYSDGDLDTLQIEYQERFESKEARELVDEKQRWKGMKEALATGPEGKEELEKFQSKVLNTTDREKRLRLMAMWHYSAEGIKISNPETGKLITAMELNNLKSTKQDITAKSKDICCGDGEKCPKDEHLFSKQWLESELQEQGKEIVNWSKVFPEIKKQGERFDTGDLYLALWARRAGWRLSGGTFGDGGSNAYLRGTDYDVLRMIARGADVDQYYSGFLFSARCLQIW